jgi:hypothetical protein
MTVNEFQLLSEIEKLKILIRYGILIGEIKEKNCRTFTYQVQTFFVDTKYALESDDLISIISFSNIEGEQGSHWSNYFLNPLYPKNYSE